MVTNQKPESKKEYVSTLHVCDKVYAPKYDSFASDVKCKVMSKEKVKEIKKQEQEAQMER